MAEAEPPVDAAPKKRSKRGLLVLIVLTPLLAGGGFYAAYSGLLTGATSGHGEEEVAEGLPDIAFVPLEPLIVSLGAAGQSQHLRFSAELEVAGHDSATVKLLTPRILDVLNSYLRAVDVAELEDPTALVRLRAQMLRRIQIVTGEGRVRDLLITEFVLN